VSRDLLAPLGPGGNLTFRPEIFDVRRDRVVRGNRRTASQDAILLFDGVFLCREELRNYWDLVIYVHISYKTGLTRAIRRDLHLSPDLAEIQSLYEARYFAGQRLYHAICDPKSYADVLVDNNDYHHPLIIGK
jgi:uridine kinase